MIYCVLKMVVIVAVISVTNSAMALEWSCEETYTSNKFNKLCKSEVNSGIDIEIKLLNHKPKYLNVQCTSQKLTHFSDFDMLEGLYLHLGYNVSFIDVKSVEIKSCILSDSLSKLIDSLYSKSGVNSVLKLNITEQKRVFDQVLNIQDVTFSKNDIAEVGVDLFEGLVNLLSLDMEENNINELPYGIFNSLRKLEFLNLGGNNINNLDAGIFQNLSQLNALFLWGNPLKTLPQRLFSGTKNLQTLDFRNCALQSVPFDVFADLHKLQDISLLKNNFSTLPQGLFKTTPLLERFTLFDNYQPLELPSGLLSNLTMLKVVLLNDNNISVVPEDLFQGSTAVTRINLERNALTTLPGDIFSDTTALITLDISSNQLTSLPDDVFASLAALESLNLSHNRLVTISELIFRRMLNLEELYLEWNALNFIHSEAFPSENCPLEILNLSHNKLNFSTTGMPVSFASVSPLRNCVQLRRLILHHNSIAQVFNDWKLFVKLSYLDLSNNNFHRLKKQDMEFSSDKITLNLVANKITRIDMDMAELQTDGSSEKKVILFLEGNPINCDCSLYTFLRYIEKSNSLNLETDAMTCTSPTELVGLRVAEVASKHVTCSVSVDCPKRCACQWRPQDGALIVNCSSLGLTDAPNRLPWNDTWKYTELHLERNLLEILPSFAQLGYDTVTKMFASHNNISRLDPENLSIKLEVLDLTSNQLTTQNSRPAFEYLLNNHWTFKNISLDKNKWRCDCEASDLLKLIHSHVGKVDNITCLDGRPMVRLSPEDICPTYHGMIVALSASLAIIGILVGLVATLYYRYQLEMKVWLYAQKLCLWFVTEEELDRDKEYDAFICYSHKDGDFVENYLVPGLETGPHSFKLCLHVRDWVPGEWITTQIVNSVKTSRRTVIVLSPNFLESVWGLVEFRTAHEQTMSDGRARVIILLYGDLGSLDTLDPELRGYLSMNTYITWDDPWFWKKMHYALPHPLHIARANKLKRVKRSFTSETIETDLRTEGGGIPLKVNTYVPNETKYIDSNDNVNRYVGLHSSPPELKTIEEEERRTACLDNIC